MGHDFGRRSVLTRRGDAWVWVPSATAFAKLRPSRLAKLVAWLRGRDEPRPLPKRPRPRPQPQRPAVR